MERTSIRELHLKTSLLMKNVARGKTYIVENRGVPVAEIRPIEEAHVHPHLPERDAFLRKIPRSKIDSGRILEEERR